MVLDVQTQLSPIQERIPEVVAGTEQQHIGRGDGAVLKQEVSPFNSYVQEGGGQMCGQRAPTGSVSDTVSVSATKMSLLSAGTEALCIVQHIRSSEAALSVNPFLSLPTCNAA